MRGGGRVLSLEFLPDEHLAIGTDPGGIHLWDLETETARAISDRGAMLDLNRDGRYLVASAQGGNKEAAIYDLVAGSSRQLDLHENAFAVALDGSGMCVVKVSPRGMRVNLSTGEDPHLLLGSGEPWRPEISPDGRWIAAVDGTSTLTLWPTPNLSRAPLHTLPIDQLVDKLRTLTNVRAVRDPVAASGWSLDVDPFPGWAEVPVW